MKRKRRYRKRYKSYTKKRYKSYRRRRGTPEVKVFDSSTIGKGIPIDIASDGTIRAANKIFGNIFSLITQGTNQFQRIGNKIFVKSVQIRCTYWTCGFLYSYSGSARSIGVNTALMRVIVDNTVGGAIDHADFFAGTNNGSKISCPLNRKVYNIRADRTFRLQGGLSSLPGDPATTASNSCGDIRSFKMNVPMNRTIVYQQTDSGSSPIIKDVTDAFTIHAISAIPNLATYTTIPYVTPVCSNWHVRIYYTDD